MLIKVIQTLRFKFKRDKLAQKFQNNVAKASKIQYVQISGQYTITVT